MVSKERRRGQIPCIRLVIERGNVSTRVILVSRFVESRPAFLELLVPSPEGGGKQRKDQESMTGTSLRESRGPRQLFVRPRNLECD